VSDALTIAGHALREAVRRRVLLVVGLLTIVFLGLYGLAAAEVFRSLSHQYSRQTGLPIDERALAGGTLLGLSMFVALFLGVVLAVFLTHGAVRGDAERGLLQPLVVRPPARTTSGCRSPRSASPRTAPWVRKTARTTPRNSATNMLSPSSVPPARARSSIGMPAWRSYWLDSEWNTWAAASP
jgi:hypothetical protein